MPKKQIALLLGFVFIDVLGYSLFFPLLPYYAEGFGAGPPLVGLMIAANAAGQIIAAPIVGSYSDHFGRRPLLIVSIAGTMISFLVLGLAEPIGEQLTLLFSNNWLASKAIASASGWTILVIFFSRILDGLSGGNVSLARAYMSDITDGPHRATGLGLIGATFGLGFVTGPAIGGILSNWEAAERLFASINLSRFAIPAFTVMLISVLNLLGVMLWLPESLPVEKRTESIQFKGNILGTGKLSEVFQHSWFGLLLIIRFFFSLALTLIMANFALYTRYSLNLNDRTTGYVMTYAGILLFLVQAIGIRVVTRHFSEKLILIRGLGLITVTFVGLSFVPNLVMLVVVLLPITVIGGTVNTILNSLISKSVDSEKVGEALGFATSAEGLTWVIAPTLGGLLIGYMGGWSLGLGAAIITGLLVAYTWRQFVTKSDVTTPSLQ